MPKIGMRIKIVETDQVFMSARIAAKYIEGDFSKIYAVVRGDRKSHKGFTFEEVADDE